MPRPFSLDDDDPPRRSRNKPPSPRPAAVIAIGAGALLVMLLACGGATLFVWQRIKNKDTDDGSDSRPDAQVAQAELPARGRPSGSAWQEGFVRVEVRSAAVIDGDMLMVIVVVESRDPDRRVNFRSWVGSGMTVTDSKGNRCLSRDFDPAVALIRSKFAQVQAAGVGSGPVDAGNPRFDLIYTDLPVSGAEYVDLDLPARNVGRPGAIRLRVPRTMWEEERAKK